jgi:hypothetical protein
LPASIACAQRSTPNAYSGRVEGGHRYVTPWAGGIRPHALRSGTVHHLRPARLSEQVISGANTFALAYGSKSVNRHPQRTRPARRQILHHDERRPHLARPRGLGARLHPDRTIGATFQALPGASFVVNGARQASDSALTTASAE